MAVVEDLGLVGEGIETGAVAGWWMVGAAFEGNGARSGGSVLRPLVVEVAEPEAEVPCRAP